MIVNLHNKKLLNITPDEI